MSTPAVQPKIGPTLDDLIAFRKTADDAMIAVGKVRDLVVPGTHAEDVWDAVVGLINELQGVYVGDHPCWAEYVDLDLG